MPILWLRGKFDGFRMYHPLSLNGYSKIINAVKRQRNLGLVTSKTIHQFENRLDKYWENHQLKIDYNSEYGPPTRRKTVKVEEDDQEELSIEDQKVLRAETTQGNIK